MERVTVAGVGDVSTGFEPPQSAFVHVLKDLRSAHLRLAQVERLYSERGSYQEQAVTSHSRQPPRMANDFTSVPFDVVSIASNHTGEMGPDAVEDTAETFRLLGISTIGAGRNIDEARRPATFTRNGLRIALLGYASVLLPQYWATDARAGAAPMRAHTFYEPYEFQPGAPAHVVTVPHAQDLEHLVRDVKQARENADVVIVSLHWGVHFVSRPCDYQPVVAHAAIEAGACAVLGHHPHQQQGIEVYKGGVIFYSIGNFSVFKAARAHRKKQHTASAPMGEFTHQEIYTIEPDPGVVFDYKRHYDEGGIAFVEADKHGLARASYLPTLMNGSGQPEVIQPDHPQFEKTRTYLNWAGKFVAGGVTDMKAKGDRYEVYVR